MKIPEIRFLLKDRNASNSTLIFMVARYENIKLVYSTGLKILPELWDFNSQRPTKDGSLLKKYKGIKHEMHDNLIMINNYENKLKEIFRTYKIKVVVPAPDKIKEELNKHFKKSKPITKELNIFKFIEEFIQNTNKRPATIKGYKTTLNHLISFQAGYNRKLTFDTVDLDFYDDFVKYFQDKGYALNTVGKNVKNVKVFMSEATERDLNSNMVFMNKRFKVPEELTDQIYLNKTEIEKLTELDLTDKPRLDNVRDIFVAACYTGLRFADLDQINTNNIITGDSGRLLKVRTQKTGETVVIPLNVIIEKILKKREGNLPRIMTNQKMNEYLKELGMLAGLTDKVPVTKTKGKLRSTSATHKYKLITVHTARRSFATNAYLAGVDKLSIMKITGHKTEKSFMKYIRITKEENAEKLLGHPFFQSKSNLKIS